MDVSVVVPAYNASGVIGETLTSVLAQTTPPREIIVVDDGSTDDTAAVVHTFPVVYARQTNAGQGAARNHGARLARGEAIAFLDSDDLCAPLLLERLMGLLERYPASGLVAVDGVAFKGDEVVMPRLIHGNLAKRLEAADDGVVHGNCALDAIAGGMLTTLGQALIPRGALDAVGPFVEARHEAEDWDMWLRLAERFPFTFSRERLFRYRVSDTSHSGAEAWRDVEYAMRRISIIRRHRARATGEIAVALDRRLQDGTALAARMAYYQGRLGEDQKARDYLRRLAREVPEQRAPRLYLAALALPEPLVRLPARLYRRIARRR